MERRQFLQTTSGIAALGLLGVGPVSAKRKPSPNARFALDFEDPTDAAANTASAAGWVVDRKAPATWTTEQGRLRIDIDETGDTSGFYAYQGRKYLDADGSYWNARTGSRLTYRFYIDPTWETDGVEQQTGVWTTLGDASGSISAYPILEYQDSDANENGEAGFRTYVYESDENGNFSTAKWVYLGLPKRLGIDPTEGGWVTVEAQLQQTDDGAALKWRVNGILVVDERGYNVFSPSAQFLEFILNSRNAGVEQTYYYDDFELTEPGAARNK